MRNIYVLCLFLLFSYSLVQAQEKSSTVKIGFYNPSVTDGGFIVGYEWGKYIDDNFDIGGSIDWFNKTFVDQKLINEFNEYNNGGVYGTTNELRAKTNLHSFPIMFNMTANFPLGNSKLRGFVSGGLGFELLIISYRDYTDPDNDNIKGAADFNWRLGFGVMHPLGKRSEIIGEVSYHSSQPSWQYEVFDNNLGRKRIFERSYDMAGVMLRLGVRFYY